MEALLAQLELLQHGTFTAAAITILADKGKYRAVHSDFRRSIFSSS